MRTFSILVCFLVGNICWGQGVVAKGKKETYDWVTPLRELTREFRGKPGMVLRLGDSITYANPGSAYLRHGKERSSEQLTVCRWMKADSANETSGIWLSYVDQPGGRSHTAASGVTSGQYLKGGKGGLPKFDDILEKYQPQIACVLLGTNDIAAKVSAEDYAKNMETIIAKLLAKKTIPVLITVPPIERAPEVAIAFNEKLWNLGERYKLPLVDYHGEILARRPTEWKGTLISKDGVHPTAVNSAGPATEENLSNGGYLLLGWATLSKLVEIKNKVIDGK